MSTVAQRFPDDRAIAVDALVAQATGAAGRHRLGFGDPRVVAFLDAVGRRLIAGPARVHAELAPLGFFLRGAHLRRALDAARTGPQRRRAPVGLVFHVPPANVETLFAYGWAMSALAGNPNVVRLPSRPSPVVDAVLDALSASLPDADPAVAGTQRFVAFARDDEAVSVLSGACRLRVLWGGDTAIGDLRRFALPATARDLTFADRTSVAVLSAPAWLGAPAPERDRVVAGFVDDAYQYDQAACSSPRVVAFTGTPAECADALAGFFAGVAAHLARHRPPVDPSTAAYHRTAVYGLAADGFVERVTAVDPSVTLLALARPYRLPGGWWGPGTFATACLGSLAELVELLDRRHQTVTHFGFTADAVDAVATEAARRGVDRIVPVGEALTFERVWDGYDLLDQFSRTVTVRAPARTG